MFNEPSVESRMLRAFDRIDELEGGLLVAVLRERLLAELFGDADTVAATLDSAFELVLHTGGTTTTLPRSAVIQGVEIQGASGVLMWTEFDDLVSDNNVVAGNGFLCSLSVREVALTTMPLAVFLRFNRDRMTSEVAFMGEAKTEVIKDVALPSLEGLRTKLVPREDH